MDETIAFFDVTVDEATKLEQSQAKEVGAKLFKTKVYILAFHFLLRCDKKLARRTGCMKVLNDIKKHGLVIRQPVIDRATKALTMQ